MMDDNTGTAIYESLDIIAYLFTTCGQRTAPLKWQFARLQTVSSILASVILPRASKSQPSTHLPARLLELYSFESSPYARLVREYLFESGKFVSYLKDTYGQHPSA